MALATRRANARRVFLFSFYFLFYLFKIFRAAARRVAPRLAALGSAGELPLIVGTISILEFASSYLN